MSSATPGLKRFVRSGSVIAVAMGIMNVAAYAFTILAARLLGPQSYGGFAAMMNLLLVAGVVSLGLQATAARRISANPEHVHRIETEIMRVTYRGAVLLGALLLLATPLINRALKLNDLPTAALVALAVVPFTVMGGQAGILQGERRWLPLGMVYLASGVPRLLIGTALILWRPTEFAAILGVAVGMFVPVIVGWLALRVRSAEREPTTAHDASAIVKEIVRNSQALLAYFALTNADIILARNVLDAHDAGLYASGIILAKAVLFLPQFVVVVAFPSMSTASERRQALTRSLGLVAGLGLLATVASYTLAPVAMVFVGGDAYAEIEAQLWLFAVLGTTLSLLQLLVYAVLARQGRRSIWFVWLALATLVAAGSLAGSVLGLLVTVVIVDLVLLATLLAISVQMSRKSDETASDLATKPLPPSQ